MDIFGFERRKLRLQIEKAHSDTERIVGAIPFEVLQNMRNRLCGNPEEILKFEINRRIEEKHLQMANDAALKELNKEKNP